MIVPIAILALGFATESSREEPSNLERFRLLMGLGDSLGAFRALFEGLGQDNILKIVNTLAESAAASSSLDELASRYQVWTDAHTIAWDLSLTWADDPQLAREKMAIIQYHGWRPGPGDRFAYVNASVFGPVPEGILNRVWRPDPTDENQLRWVLSWDADRILIHKRSTVMRGETSWGEVVEIWPLKDIGFTGQSIARFTGQPMAFHRA